MRDRLMLDELQQLQKDIIYATSMMKQLEAQHPTAKVTFNLTEKRVDVTYPIPKDMKNIDRFLKGVTFNTPHNY